MFEALQRDRDDEWHCIDSTINLAHQRLSGFGQRDDFALVAIVRSPRGQRPRIIQGHRVDIEAFVIKDHVDGASTEDDGAIGRDAGLGALADGEGDRAGGDRGVPAREDTLHGRLAHRVRLDERTRRPFVELAA